MMDTAVRLQQLPVAVSKTGVQVRWQGLWESQFPETGNAKASKRDAQGIGLTWGGGEGGEVGQTGAYLGPKAVSLREVQESEASSSC